MDPVTIALLAGTAIKGISSLIKNRKGKKMEKAGESQMNKALNDIKYTRPEEHDKIMSLLGNRQSGINTRREMVEDRVRSSTSSGIAGIRQLADSPVAALGAYGGLKEQEQNAIADVGVQFEGMRDEATMGMVQGEEMGAGYSEKEQYYNDIYKNMVKANLGGSKMEAGRNQAWQGFEGMASAGLDLVGTTYLSSKMNPTEDLGSAGEPS